MSGVIELQVVSSSLKTLPGKRTKHNPQRQEVSQGKMLHANRPMQDLTPPRTKRLENAVPPLFAIQPPIHPKEPQSEKVSLKIYNKNDSNRPDAASGHAAYVSCQV